MTRQCAGIKRDGGRCTVVVNGPNDYCYQHDPSRADERRRNASRAGSTKPSREIAALKAQLQEIADGVIAGSILQGRGAVAVQALNAKSRVLELERRILETQELEERLARLEMRFGVAR